jgi:hypothetical protein
MKYTTTKTGYSKKASIWNFIIPGEKQYDSLKWAKRRAQSLATETGVAKGVVSIGGTFRIIRDSPMLKPQHRDLIFMP